MATNEEQIEAAKRIRLWCPQSFTHPTEIVRAALGLKQGDLMDDSTRINLAERVAELIEPESERTGHAVEDVSIGGYVSWRCSECEQPINKADNYCSNCGVRLVAKAVE